MSRYCGGYSHASHDIPHGANNAVGMEEPLDPRGDLHRAVADGGGSLLRGLHTEDRPGRLGAAGGGDGLLPHHVRVAFLHGEAVRVRDAQQGVHGVDPGPGPEPGPGEGPRDRVRVHGAGERRAAHLLPLHHQPARDPLGGGVRVRQVPPRVHGADGGAVPGAEDRAQGLPHVPVRGEVRVQGPAQEGRGLREDAVRLRPLLRPAGEHDGGLLRLGRVQRAGAGAAWLWLWLRPRRPGRGVPAGRRADLLDHVLQRRAELLVAGLDRARRAVAGAEGAAAAAVLGVGVGGAGGQLRHGGRRAGVSEPVQGRRRGAHPREHHRARAAGLGRREEARRRLHVRLHEEDVQGEQRHLQRAS
jgi:hypothetical protein